jgi:hypothetical protein
MHELAANLSCQKVPGPRIINKKAFASMGATKVQIRKVRAKKAES